MKKNEEEKYQICWNITSRCNQNCKYCHRFLGIKELSLKDNKKILKKLIKDGITDITWTGGEALLYKDVIKLMKIANEAGVRNKLITNGIIFSELKDKEKDELCKNLESIVLSIDSINNEVNQELGRGFNHYNTVKKDLEYLKDKEIKININTVLNRKNLDQIEDLAQFLNNYKIDTWKFFRFMPLRELAKENKEEFEITDKEFSDIIEKYNYLSNVNKMNYKQEEQIEERVLIVENGDIIMTEDGNEETIDVKKGNAMTDSVIEIIKESRRKANQSNFRDKLKVDINQHENKNCIKYPQCCNGAHKKEKGKEPDIDD